MFCSLNLLFSDVLVAVVVVVCLLSSLIVVPRTTAFSVMITEHIIPKLVEYLTFSLTLAKTCFLNTKRARSPYNIMAEKSFLFIDTDDNPIFQFF